MTTEDLLIMRTKEALATPTDLSSDAVRDISAALNVLLADMFALYVKTKNFHWHVCDHRPNRRARSQDWWSDDPFGR